MRVARHWVRETQRFPYGKSQTAEEGCWGWSENSEAEARSRSRALTERFAAWLGGVSRGRFDELGGEYDYLNRPPREELLQEFLDPDGATVATITRNRYGAMVLSTDRLVMLDCDLPSPGALGWVSRLLWGEQETPEQRRLAEIRRAAAAAPDLAVRVYRTAAGFRALVTNVALRATEPRARKFHEDFRCDHLYKLLCESQECYRARLTPKPWRIGLQHPRRSWPATSAAEEADFVEWLAQYEERKQGVAVCRLVESLGPREVLEEHQPLIDLHDRLTGVGRAATLA